MMKKVYLLLMTVSIFAVENFQTYMHNNEQEYKSFTSGENMPKVESLLSDPKVTPAKSDTPLLESSSVPLIGTEIEVNTDSEGCRSTKLYKCRPRVVNPGGIRG